MTRLGRWIIWSMRRQIPPGVRTRVSPVTQGLEALMRPDLGQVCHWLMVSSYCTPGSAQRQAAKAICSHRSRALMVLATLPLVRHGELPVAVFFDGFEEAVGDADGVVGILAGDGDVGFAVEIVIELEAELVGEFLLILGEVLDAFGQAATFSSSRTFQLTNCSMSG